MRKHNPKNERIKRRYFDYLKEAKRMDTSSIDMAAAAITGFEQWANYRDFARFHIEQAKNFKAHLSRAVNEKTGKPLAKATIHSRLMALKAFVFWLAGQPGYKARISYADADYFNPSANDSRIATARREKKVPTIDQIKLVLSNMPTGSDIEKRDRAIIAFTLLTGARDDAVASLRLKHVNLADRSVFQDGREVRTKNRKTFTSYFFPVGDDVEAIVRDWMQHLAETLMFGPDDPLFPATEVSVTNTGLFGAVGLSRKQWRNAAAIRRIFKAAFEGAGLPYSNPHSFRDTLGAMGEQRCKTPEEFKAWSQNLGHEKVMTTFTSYGAVASGRQAEIMGSLNAVDTSKTDDETLNRLAIVLMERIRGNS